MKKGRGFAFVISIGCFFLSAMLYSDSSYQIPIDGARAFAPNLDSQNEGTLGYITVSSISSDGALNSQVDQESADQLLIQLTEQYLEIYNKYKNRVINGPKSYRLPEKRGPTSCSHRRSARWRQS